VEGVFGDGRAPAVCGQAAGRRIVGIYLKGQSAISMSTSRVDRRDSLVILNVATRVGELIRI
jgi:hypothetical protein